MPSREELLAIKSSLKFAWEPFFSRFGVFTPIQAQAIPVILSGRDCLLASRTASGKTEAATAPIVERLKAERWDGLSVVYISPTRALVNDLFRRLESRLAELGVTVRPRTADSPNINPGKPPHVLITTPESFDSLLARNPRMFINARAVVLDEIHLLDGAARGDQVRLLLHRLRALRGDAFERGDAPTDQIQVVALSATVSDPHGVAARYCLDPAVVKAEGKREIMTELIPLKAGDQFLQIISGFASGRIRKVLAFCGSRVECENYASLLRGAGVDGMRNPFGDQVFVHHASLDRRVRIDTEARFAQGQAGICFATSTLELGVDIGDIDLVILVGPPYSVGSFLQRIGRGNRRTNRTTVLGLFRSPRERSLFELLVAAAKEGVQDETLYSFHASVLIQQILSYLKQSPGGSLSQRQVRVLLNDPHRQSVLLDSPAERDLLDHLVNEDILRRAGRGGEFTPGDGARALYERFQEYSNIDSGGRGVMVVDDLTGRVIGEIEERNLRRDESFVFGANRLGLVRAEQRKVMVNVDNAREPTRKLRFSSRGPTLPFHLARKLGLAGGIVDGEMPAFEFGGHWCVAHALGDVYGRMLSQMLAQEYGWKSRAGAMALTSAQKPPACALVAEGQVVNEILRRDYQKYEALLGLGKFQSYLPELLRRMSVESAFAAARFCDAVNGRRITVLYDAERIERILEVL